MPTRSEDVGGERIMLGSHFLNGRLHLANRPGKRLERVIQATGMHYVQSNISPSLGQSPLLERPSEQPQTVRNHARLSGNQAREHAERDRSGRQQGPLLRRVAQERSRPP
jgi:hypothetical protein